MICDGRVYIADVVSMAQGKVLFRVDELGNPIRFYSGFDGCARTNPWHGDSKGCAKNFLQHLKVVTK